jgi:hypothetical protein
MLLEHCVRQYGLSYDKMVCDDDSEAERLHQEHSTATRESSFFSVVAQIMYAGFFGG